MVPDDSPNPAAAPGETLATELLIPSLRLLVVIGATLSAGWLAGQWPGIEDPSAFSATSPLWPQAGIALAALYFWGPTMALGLLAGNGGLAWLQNMPPWPAALHALTGVLAPALALALLQGLGWRTKARSAEPNSARDLALFLGIGVALNAALGAGAELGLHALFSAADAPTSRAWTPWFDLAGMAWAGHAVGILLIVAPLLATHRVRAALALLLSLLAVGVAAAAASRQLAPKGSLEAWAWLWSGLSVITLLPLLADALQAWRRTEGARWLSALEADGTGVAEWRADGGMRAGARWEQHCTFAMPDDVDPVQWLDLAHPLDRERLIEALQTLLGPGGHETEVQTLRLPAPSQLLGTVHGTGAWRWHSLRVHVQQRDKRGHAVEVLMLLSDISAQRQAEERQRMSMGLFQHLHEGLLVVDEQHRVVDANPSYCRMMGGKRESLLGKPAALLLSPSLLRSGASTEEMLAALKAEGFWRARVLAERGDGSPCTLQLTVSSIPESSPQSGSARLRVVTVTDLTQAVQQQQQLELQAHSDALTGLPNQEEFVRQLRRGLEAAEREDFGLSVCRVDMDQFKRINTEYGDKIGDALLQQVAQRLRDALRGSPQWSDVVARLSGDEFGLILRTADADEAKQALGRLLNVLRMPCRLPAPRENQTVELTASIGATLYPADTADAETLLRHAGHALYRVKQHSGHNDFRFFDTAKRQRDEASLIAIARMQQALDSGELRLFYQPKIDMHAGRVLGVEALLRWQHPEQGLLLPGDILPQIAGTGLEVQVGDWIIGQALKQSAQWLSEGLALEVSVNVAARQLQVPDFAQRLQELVQRHTEPVATHLCLEVLESEALADVEATHALIQRCKAFGVRFALDDFGTGYSTLTYLRNLPVDTLKIDRSFVQNMLIDVQDMALIEGVVGLARHFGCGVVAEGVESAAHARALLRLGCQQGQGNGIASAMPAPDVSAWIEAFARSPWLIQLAAERPAKAELAE